MTTRKSLGDFGERIARTNLEAHGYRILATKFRTREGEIDIVARQDDTVVFIEVKTRRGDAMGAAAESLSTRQAHRLRTVADAFCQQHDDLPPGRRIDLIAIDLESDGRVASFEHIENVIDGE